MCLELIRLNLLLPSHAPYYQPPSDYTKSYSADAQKSVTSE